MSETSKASLSSGQIVGPLWTWMFLIPSSAHLSRNGRASGSVSFQPRESAVPLGGVELDALQAVLGVVFLELAQAGLAVTRVPATVEDQAVLEPLLHLGVLLDRVEALRVPLLEVRRLEDRLVDVAFREDVLLEVVHRVLLEVLDRPVRLRRAEALVGVETLDPALRELLLALHPVVRARVPEMQVGVEDEVLLAVLLVHLAPPTRQAGGRSRGTRRRPPGWRTATRGRRGPPYAHSGCS